MRRQQLHPVLDLFYALKRTEIFLCSACLYHISAALSSFFFADSHDSLIMSYVDSLEMSYKRGISGSPSGPGLDREVSRGRTFDNECEGEEAIGGL